MAFVGRYATPEVWLLSPAEQARFPAFVERVIEALRFLA
jgi:hypothetical protein